MPACRRTTRDVRQYVDRNVPLFQITTLEEQLDSSFAQTRQAALLSGLASLP